MHKDIWTDRQIMLGDVPFEFYHYLDEVPPQVDFHQHPFYELFFFLGGNVNYSIEGKTYALRPGDVLLTNSHDVHRPEILPGKPYERVVVWLSDDFFKPFSEGGEALLACFRDAATKDYRLIRPDEQSHLRLFRLCQRITQAQNSREIGGAALRYALVTEFLVEVCRCYYRAPTVSPGDVTENSRINQVIGYINGHIGEELTLETLAERFFVSKFFLSKQFKQYAGLSIYQYIMKKRLTLAREALLRGSSVTEAFLASGFNDYSNFLKAFKREYGSLPKQLRRE